MFMMVHIVHPVHPVHMVQVVSVLLLVCGVAVSLPTAQQEKTLQHSLNSVKTEDLENKTNKEV